VSAVSGECDIVLAMTVNPGWGGQAFIESSPAKVEQLRAMDGAARIEVDGGIDAQTAPRVVEAGATLLVAGSAIFSADDPGSAYQAIAAAAGAV
jgi:ribulose-phosphate 3-epimerase